MVTSYRKHQGFPDAAAEQRPVQLRLWGLGAQKRQIMGVRCQIECGGDSMEPTGSALPVNAVAHRWCHFFLDCTCGVQTHTRGRDRRVKGNMLADRLNVSVRYTLLVLHQACPKSGPGANCATWEVTFGPSYNPLYLSSFKRSLKYIFALFLLTFSSFVQTFILFGFIYFVRFWVFSVFLGRLTSRCFAVILEI